MEVIRQAILDTFGQLQPTCTDTMAAESIQAKAQQRCGLTLKVRQIMLDYRGEGFLTDYEYQGREYRTFWPLSQAASLAQSQEVSRPKRAHADVRKFSQQ